MRQSYRSGLRSSLRQWKVVALVYVISFLGGCAFMACAWIWLASVLDASLATRGLLTSLDVHVFIDIARNHTAGVRMFASLALLLATGASLLWIGVNGIVVAAVTGQRASLAEASGAGLARYGAFVTLWIATIAAHALTIGGAYLGTRLLLDMVADGSGEWTSYVIIAAGALAGSAVVLGIATVHDHARIRCLETNDPAWRAGLWACVYVLREPRAVPLALCLIATTAVGWILYQVVSDQVAADSAVGLTLSLVWAQGFMLFRAFVRVWAFASAFELQSGWEGE